MMCNDYPTFVLMNKKMTLVIKAHIIMINTIHIFWLAQLEGDNCPFIMKCPSCLFVDI